MQACSSVTVREILKNGEKQFCDAKLYFYHGTDNPFDEALVILSYVLKIDLSSSSIDFDRKLTKEEEIVTNNFFKKRISLRIPASYITNIAYFAGRQFFVDERVMIPTSPIAEVVLNHFSPWVDGNPKKMMDLCTGSGAIAVTMALEFLNAKIDCVDISKDALNVAKENIKKYQLSDRINLIHSDLFNNVKGQYDVIVSNPPYVDEKDYAKLPQEFSYEPKIAFTADNEGLEIVEKILQKASKYLKKDGVLIIEVGAYIEQLEQYFPNVPFTWIELQNGGEGVFVFKKSELEKYFNKIN